MIKDLSSVKTVHFIGIGGVGISAIARFFLRQGKKVTGSDQSLDSPVIKELQRFGILVHQGHRVRQVPRDADLIVYSLAIPDNNPERQAAVRRGLPALSYPEVLGLISRDKYTIAVAGTHGKTTTTAMLGEVLRAAKLDPTVIVGSLMRAGKTNLWVGRSKYLVVEACEYRESFLNLSPQILIVTNIDNDHLDYYKNLNAIQAAFNRLASKVRRRRGRVITENEYRRIKLPIKLRLPGAHNQRNAQAAIAAARALGVSERLSRRALANFAGTWRRFEYLGRTRAGALIYDDYAHHPTEIMATLEAARERFPQKRLFVVFQPHLYSRTKLLLADFASSFRRADKVMVLPIYAAREPRDRMISSQILVSELKRRGQPVKYLPNFVSAEKYLTDRAGRGDIILTMGAGNIFTLGHKLRYN